MIVTTSSRANAVILQKAREIASEVGGQFQIRGRDSIKDIQTEFNSEVLVVGKTRTELFLPGNEEPIFFHPNSAMFRIKRLISGGHDPLVNACGLTEGMTFLDCSLGLASDAIVASYAIGSSGVIKGIEGNKTTAYLVRAGLKTWDSGITKMNTAMRKIDVIWENSNEYLKTSGDHSVDVIYFDPMFEETIESSGIKGIKHLALYDDVTLEMIQEAKRVAKKRIVLKDHWKSSRFQHLGFTPIVRKSSNFHYGVLDLG
ncbi:class I SAM-dependent methyltransferase [Bacillus suaedaesalsae]|uniref:Class I SAM-dependent methyltransferase n=1 Tax=Bacillus suaedaesalsae TaxID=2810349 RepID=A0ABS2DP10_9BACI|nr:class I SAM-dependent methyltransferase [Bacillus suaedaesalsae]MBM6619348.1 class I SAM-dependent methyltransferase [Bacillus suaedaesalsae]